jgi:hypothetical protein
VSRAKISAQYTRRTDPSATQSCNAIWQAPERKKQQRPDQKDPGVVVYIVKQLGGTICRSLPIRLPAASFWDGGGREYAELVLSEISLGCGIS